MSEKVKTPNMRIPEPVIAFYVLSAIPFVIVGMLKGIEMIVRYIIN